MYKTCLITGLWILLFSCSSRSDGPAAVDPPAISVVATEFSENSGITMLEFELSSNSETPVELSYQITGKSAVIGEDLETSSGSLTFAPGETKKLAQISILSDDILEFDETFLVRVDNIVNAIMINNEVEVTIIDDDNFTPEEDADGFITPASYPSMQLVWSDEFDGTELNSNHWDFETGNGCPDLCGWGNGELQHYSDENALTGNGSLVITASNPMGSIYTSARINSKGKQEFKYGRIDIRAKLPFGQGIWPAIWMLGSNIDQVAWPECGEIDIMEMVGHQPGTVHGTAHYDRDGHEFVGTGWPLSAPQKYADKYHIFTILWQQDLIEWYVDYNKFFSVKAKDVGFNYPFDQPFFFILNVAVGGEWPGEPDATTQFPQAMEIDYIRVFQTAGMD